MSHVTTHVLDTAIGAPAAGVRVSLTGPDGALIATGSTDADGRVAHLGPDRLTPGEYRLEFTTAAYFGATGRPSFYPRAVVYFMVEDAPHYHVPLLLSPFGYSTYRGS